MTRSWRAPRAAARRGSPCSTARASGRTTSRRTAARPPPRPRASAHARRDQPARAERRSISRSAFAPLRARPRAIAARTRSIPEDLVLGCHDEHALVLHGDDTACLSSVDVCPPATTWDRGGARCLPLPACPPGEIRPDAASGACVRVVIPGAKGEALVDVGRWTRTVLGPDGGEGTSRLCRQLAIAPWDLDVGPGGARTLLLQLDLRFPDNDVTQVSARVALLDSASRQPVGRSSGTGTNAGRAAQRALDALLLPLRALGGTADAASATLQVQCTVQGGGTPFVFPRPLASAPASE